jgi:putative membrane protein
MTTHLQPDRHYTAQELAAVLQIRRPHRNLMKYYVLSSLPALLFPPIWPFTLLLLYFRYHTMQYRFDGEGVMMRWGILYRREVMLGYGRIQDIHLVSNFFERWLGLARIQISTASGSSSAEMTIEGLQEYELVRDFLYARMRGASRITPAAAVPARPTRLSADPSSLAPLVAALQQVSQDLRAVRTALEKKSGAAS